MTITNQAAAAAFYIPKEEEAELNPDPNMVQDIKTKVSNMLNDLKMQITGFDPKEFAKNFAVQCPTKFVQRYATQAFIKAVSGKPIKSHAMLDVLFLHFAPQLNMTAAFLGYNGLTAMKLALKNGSGEVNTGAFVQGFSYALQAFQNEKRIEKLREKYGDELPIDVLQKCEFVYQNKEVEHPVSQVMTKQIDYVTKIDIPIINVIGLVKNKYGEFEKSNTYVQKLGVCMANKTPITFRVGKDIYENCTIEEMKPSIDNGGNAVGGIYVLKLDITLRYNYYQDNYAYAKDGVTILNADPTNQNFIGDPDAYRYTV